MVRITFWLKTLLVMFVMKQSDAFYDQCRGLQEQMSRLVQAIAGTTDLKHANESLACQCFEKWAKEICISQKTSSEIKETESAKNDLKKQMEAEEVLKSNNNNQTQLQTTIDGVTNIANSLNNRTNISRKCSTSTNKACRYLIKAAKTGDVNSAKRWVNCVNGNCATHGTNITPLIYAAIACHLEVVRVLLQGGADIEAPIFNNNTALHIAALNGCVDVCRLLLDWGAKLDTPRNGKYTPLLAAAHGGHLSVVKLLVERGADVRVRNDFGRNASQEARSLGKKDVAEWLEEVVKNCDLKENACPSLIAARSGGVNRAKGLAMCGSSDNCTDGSFFPDTPQTDVLHQVHVDIASTNSRLRDRLAKVKVTRNSKVTKAPEVMSNDYEPMAKEFEDQIVKEFEEQIANKSADVAKEFEEQAARDNMMTKLQEKPEPLKLNENWAELPERYKVGENAQHLEEHLQHIFV